MIVSLALVVFGSSIAVFFSEEIQRMFKKIIAIPGAKLLVPLIALSLLVEIYQEYGSWLLIAFKAIIEQGLLTLVSMLPFQVIALPMLKAAYLILLACLPVWVFWLIAKRKGIEESWPTPYRVGVMLWTLAAVLLTVQL